MNIKTFQLISRINETRHISWHETCKCKCRLDVSVSNDKQRLNNDKCSCDCKGMQVYANMIVIDHVMLENTLVTKFVNVEKHCW